MLSDQNWLLSVGTFLPLVGVVLMFFVPKHDEVTAKGIAVITAAATLVIGIITLINFDYDQSEKLQFFVDHKWIEVISSRYIVGLDGLSLPLYILSMIITLLVMLYSWNHVPSPGNPKAFYILMLVLQVGT